MSCGLSDVAYWKTYYEFEGNQNMLNYLRYRYAKARMPAFVNGELPPKSRRFIARLIDDDSRVYQDYIRQRQTKQELERQLPTFGRPDSGQLDALWTTIQTQISSKDTADSVSRSVSPSRYPVGYGLAMILCVVALSIPLTFDSTKASASSLPQQPQPEIAVTLTTPSRDTPAAEPTTVAYVAETQPHATDNLASDLQNTPEPNTPG